MTSQECDDFFGQITQLFALQPLDLSGAFAGSAAASANWCYGHLPGQSDAGLTPFAMAMTKVLVAGDVTMLGPQQPPDRAAFARELQGQGVCLEACIISALPAALHGQSGTSRSCQGGLGLGRGCAATTHAAYSPSFLAGLRQCSCEAFRLCREWPRLLADLQQVVKVLAPGKAGETLESIGEQLLKLNARGPRGAAAVP